MLIILQGAFFTFSGNLACKNELDFSSLFSLFCVTIGINSDHRIEDDGKHVYVIQHKLGEVWSLFIKEFLILIFENLGKVKVDISSTPNTTVAKVFLNS